MLQKPFGGTNESQETFLLDRLLITAGVLVIAGVAVWTVKSTLVLIVPLLLLSYGWGWGILRNMRGSDRAGPESRFTWREVGYILLFLLFGAVIGLLGMAVGVVWLIWLKVRKRQDQTQQKGQRKGRNRVKR